jgi:hypothetical protein
MFLFRGDPEALGAMLEAYGPPADKFDERSSQRLLAWTLLHRFTRFASHFRRELEGGGPTSLEALAGLVFPRRR